MKVSKDTIAEVVQEASVKMSDPNYSAVMVGGFVQNQPPTAQYISTYESDVGGTENIVNIIFHAALIDLCYQRAEGRSTRTMSFEDLDHVSGADSLARLEARQPAVHEYIVSNVENPVMQKILSLIALAIDWVR